jgi:hypothetical protein
MLRLGRVKILAHKEQNDGKNSSAGNEQEGIDKGFFHFKIENK